ncbi:MAG: M23 family metallopeptidase [Dehalococcoidia bacterium]|nr:M23 family metallopeptidase [Dehalococcoidia bacterium]
MAVGQTRVISHGFLFMLILAVTIYLYLGLSSRGFATEPTLSWTNETSYSFYSDGYLLRPVARPNPLNSATTAASATAQKDTAQEAKTASTPELATTAAQGQAASGKEDNTATAPERGEPLEYEVVQGDTVSTIAERFGISTQTILWTNNMSNADFIKLGQKLLILPVSGLFYAVEKGDSLLYIASQFGVDTEAILGYKPNGLSNADSLAIGQRLIIPGGTVSAARAAPSSRGGARLDSGATAAQAVPAAAPPSGNFIWPNSGLITQYFSAGHSGLDIATAYGTPIVAADGGVVVDEQKLGGGLGWYITIDHGNGYSTTYSHMSSFAVGMGERVSQGQMIGRVGSTGWSTGPHDHFVVERNGMPINPLNVLP